MSKGFDVEFEVPKEQIDVLLKEYKKLKKYKKSNLFTIEKLDGKDTIIDQLTREAEEDPID